MVSADFVAAYLRRNPHEVGHGVRANVASVHTSVNVRQVLRAGPWLR